jgi:uncharacterized protein YciI
MNHFLLKLVPPRPTFAKDMNDDEKNLMQQHAKYFEQLQERGVALAYGPVLDPRGSWGMAILEVENENEAKEILNSDPTVKAALNTFEIYPMRAFVQYAQNKNAAKERHL